ncbi:hypothetical protein AJ80_07472 [Polytolypa hystricis UAMH7299]|uniref:Cupin type-2 domain-containing protein n=1 Tax=Polytolypa hystricis (strain UAMH7299) TaxID=1447883 RepID=A0A2B7XPD3_POLH7|nr:hypothetical protein AJ80_07472 [Polytolypa hystricis UAMH7299]
MADIVEDPVYDRTYIPPPPFTSPPPPLSKHHIPPYTYSHFPPGSPSRPLPTIKLAYNFPLVDVPGKSSIGLLVSFPPNAASPPHRHGGANVSAYLIKGTVLNKMNNDPTRIIRQGGAWHEKPGCHHRVSENYSETEEAVLLAAFVVDTEVVEKEGYGALVQVDEEYGDLVMEFKA